MLSHRMDKPTQPPYHTHPHTKQILKRHGRSLTVTRKPTEAVKGAHVVVTDTWVRCVRWVCVYCRAWTHQYQRQRRRQSIDRSINPSHTSTPQPSTFDVRYPVSLSCFCAFTNPNHPSAPRPSTLSTRSMGQEEEYERRVKDFEGYQVCRSIYVDPCQSIGPCGRSFCPSCRSVGRAFPPLFLSVWFGLVWFGLRTRRAVQDPFLTLTHGTAHFFVAGHRQAVGARGPQRGVPALPPAARGGGGRRGAFIVYIVKMKCVVFIY